MSSPHQVPARSQGPGNFEVEVPEKAVEVLARANYEAASKGPAAPHLAPYSPARRPFEEVRKGYEDGARACFRSIGPAIPAILAAHESAIDEAVEELERRAAKASARAGRFVEKNEKTAANRSRGHAHAFREAADLLRKARASKEGE